MVITHAVRVIAASKGVLPVERGSMGIIWTICMLLVAFWAIGLVLHLFGGALHLLLVAAAVLFVIGMFSGRRTSI